MKHIRETFEIKAIGLLHKVRVLAEPEKEVAEIAFPEIQSLIFSGDFDVFIHPRTEILHPY